MCTMRELQTETQACMLNLQIQIQKPLVSLYLSGTTAESMMLHRHAKIGSLFLLSSPTPSVAPMLPDVVMPEVITPGASLSN